MSSNSEAEVRPDTSPILKIHGMSAGCESGRMAQTSCVILSPDDRERLAAIIADRNRPLKHVQRARIILHSDERLSVLEVAKRAGVSRPAVWRWQQRYAEEGIGRTRPGRPLGPGRPASVTHDY